MPLGVFGGPEKDQEFMFGGASGLMLFLLVSFMPIVRPWA